MLTGVDGKTSRRGFLGLAAAGLAGAAVAACDSGPPSAGGQAAGHPVASTATRPWRPWRRPVPENSLPGDAHWAIRHQGSEHAIEGYAGKASVLPGESFPLFVSTLTPGFRVTAFRLGWYQGTGARNVWSSRTIRGGRQKSPAVAGATNTVKTDWDPVIEVPTHGWPAGAYLLRLDADSGAQRYVPVTVRSASTAGKVVLKSCVQTWQAYNTWGGYDLYKGPSGAYASRSYAVSLDRPYDENGANMFLTYERNVIKLAEHMLAEHGGLDLAYVTGMDIAADPHLLDGASALVSMGHDEYWTPEERANVTAARDRGMNLAFLGANALFRRTRLDPTALGAARLVVCYKTAYTRDPMYRKDPAEVTSDWREPPNSDPESSLTGTIYEGYPVDAAYVVSSPSSWVFKGTGISAGDSFPHLVGVEYDRVNPAYPVQRPIEVLSHSPLTCQGASSYGDSAYYTHTGGAGVFNCGTMRWVEAIYGDQPHGIGGKTPDFVRRVTMNVLRAFAGGPAAVTYRARDNLESIHEDVGDPVGNPQDLQ
jgi:N,N-dimethylformamidase beta subunit-like, C-terminal